MKHSMRIAPLILALLPLAARGDVTATVTMGVQSFLNLTTGSTSITGADILWSGTTTPSSCTPSCALSFQGGAKGLNLGAIGSEYGALTQALLQQFAAEGSTTPIPSSSLSVGDVFAVEGNSGNFTKAMVTANTGTSLTFTYTTFGASGGGGTTGGGTAAPSITNIQNNSSLIPAGFGNSGIAPSSIFVIHGSNMASATTVTSLVDTTKGPLPTTAGLNGAVVTVTAGGKTYTPGLYYAEATQIAGVMPAAVPPGPATVTVSYNGQTSSAYSFTVIAAAFGIDVYNGNYAVLQDSVTGAIITPTNSAKAGEPITIWGTAIGADPGDSDVSYSSAPQAINTPVQVYIGGVQVPQSNILYVGSLGYPGVNGVVLNVPSNIPAGCFDSVAVVANNTVVSNVAVGSFMPNGGVCTDTYTGLNGTTINSLTGSTNYSSGIVEVGQLTTPSVGGGSPTVNDIALADFEQVSGSYSISSSGTISVGSCSLLQGLTSTGTVTVTETGLNAGTVTVTPPGGGPVTLQTIPQETGIYEAQLTSGAIPTSGGTFAFSATGASGANSVGAFTANVNFPNPILSWTNQSAAANITRSAGLTYNWSGGAPGTFVIVSGSSSSSASGVSGSYSCIFPQSAGTGTVPAYILDALPAGNGTSSIENSTSFNSFSATNLTYGYAIGFVSFSVNSIYQ